MHCIRVKVGRNGKEKKHFLPSMQEKGVET
jgi:hypothetical protein